MVKVKYGAPYKKSFGKAEEEIKAKTIEGVVATIEKKYKKKEFVETIRLYSIVVYNNDKFIPKTEKDGKYVYDSNIELKEDDELLFMMLVGGG